MAKKKLAAKEQPKILENGNLLVYSFNHLGIYVGTEQAYPDPLTPGEFLLPAGATELAPPSPVDGKVVKWTGTDWELENIPTPEPTPEPTTAELTEAARGKRNGLLYACDWTQLGDVPASVTANLAAWQTYRQALRDVPQQGGFPTTINWPTAP